jgi:hypothetical protein
VNPRFCCCFWSDPALKIWFGIRRTGLSILLRDVARRLSDNVGNSNKSDSDISAILRTVGYVTISLEAM